MVGLPPDHERHLKQTGAWALTVGAIVVASLVVLIFVVPSPQFHSGPPYPNRGYSQPTYAVTLEETGLQTGGNWTVSVGPDLRGVVGANTQTTGGPTMSFVLANGTYEFQATVSTVGATSTSVGTFAVVGSNATVVVPLVYSTESQSLIQLDFTGTYWGENYINVSNGDSFSSTDAALVLFSLPKGNYTFSVQTDNRHYASVPSWVTVGLVGQPVWVEISANPVYYQLCFNETGLPPGIQWNMTTSAGVVSYVELGNSSCSDAWNLTYGFVIWSTHGYVPYPSSGKVTVAGGPVTVFVRFVSSSTGG